MSDCAADITGESTSVEGLLRFTFMATISLAEADITEAGGNVGQAIQNEIGRTGASVIEVVSV